MKRYTSKLSAIGIALLALLVFSFPSTGFSAYQEPNSSLIFPAYDSSQIPDLLNGSSELQTLLGDLSIGQTGTSSCSTGLESGCARLCLNAPLITNSYPDTTSYGDISKACISSWTGLVGMIISNTTAVRKLTSPFVSPRTQHNDSLDANDTVDNGAISLQADVSLFNVGTKAGQLVSLLVEAPDTTAISSLYPTAIYADGPGTLQYAATFAGRLAVMSDPEHTQQLCLNDLGDGSKCLITWADLTTKIDQTVVRLLKVNTTDNRYHDPGVTDVSGILVTQSFSAGSPTQTTPPSITCGNGICDTINGETPVLCSTDCSN